jgi:hypothetical protein
MRLGPESWEKSKWYYDGLSIVNEGDITEQTGADRYGLTRDMPNYERFWRYHIAPATQRPFSIRVRDEADEIVKLIAQRSYSVFSNILEAITQLEVIQHEGLGERTRNATIAIKFAGDALLMFDELEQSAFPYSARAFG